LQNHGHRFAGASQKGTDMGLEVGIWRCAQHLLVSSLKSNWHLSSST